MHDDERALFRQPRNGPRNLLHAAAIFEKLAPELQHNRSAHRSPTRSSMPDMTLKFWTADPAAPLSRLSITETITARPVVSSTFHPMSQKLVHATCLISGNVVPVSRTNGACTYARSNAAATSASVAPSASRTYTDDRM